MRAFPRATALPLDLQARRRRLRANDRPRRRRSALQLADEFTLVTPAWSRDEPSIDGTRKFVLELGDGRRIEAVFIPDTPAMTFCISTQVGCAMGCGFCLTGKMGLVRNLTAGEIAGQVRVLAARHRPARPPVQHRADGDGRAAAQLRQHDEGAPHASCRARPRRVAAARHALDRRDRARAEAAGARAAHAEPRDLAARDDRRAARRAGAAESEISAGARSSRRAGGSR